MQSVPGRARFGAHSGGGMAANSNAGCGDGPADAVGGGRVGRQRLWDRK